jgi:site-specific DNA recombinase
MAARLMANDHGDRADEKTAVVAYLRVSTPGQAEDGLGLQIQQDQIQAYLKRNPSLTLLKTFRDEGHSGSSLERPALQALLTEAKEKLFTKVIVAKLDRLARDLYVQLFLEKELLVHGIEVVSLAESFNGKDPIMVAMRQIVGVFAQLERGRITERLLAGRRKKLESGQYAGGKPPMGYCVRNSELVIDPTEADVIQRIFRHKMGRHSFGWIARRLNADGIKPRRGTQFYPSTVRYILMNPAYRGIARYGTQTKGIHERIPL